jgi:hypothetical protein
MTDNELKELVASLAIAQKETDRQLKETDQQLKETALHLQETDRQLKATDQQLKTSRLEVDRQLKELRVQIGGLGNKFGTFTEGMAFPAMERILRREFGLEHISQNNKVEHGDQTLELDVLGYSNGANNKAVVVEVKSHLRPRDIEQVLQILHDFPRFFPEHATKQLYGMIATVAATKETRQQVLEQGLYLGMIHDEQFKLTKPRHFLPKCFTATTE